MLKKFKKLTQEAIAAKIAQFAKCHCDQTDAMFTEARMKGKTGPDAFREAYIWKMRRTFPDDPYLDEVIEEIENASTYGRSGPIQKAMAKATENASKRTGFTRKRYYINAHTMDPDEYTRWEQAIETLELSKGAFVRKAVNLLTEQILGGNHAHHQE